jgi:hypothetical protein
VNGISGQGNAMNVSRKFLAVISAVLSILFILLTFRAIGVAVSNYHSSTVFGHVALWFLVAVLLGLSFVLMRFADRNLR